MLIGTMADLIQMIHGHCYLPEMIIRFQLMHVNGCNLVITANKFITNITFPKCYYHYKYHVYTSKYRYISTSRDLIKKGISHSCFYEDIISKAKHKGYYMY